MVIGALVVLGFLIDHSASSANVEACKTERATLLTASAAAETSNKVSSDVETWRDYVESDALKYFEENNGLGFDRKALDDVPEKDCGASF